MIRTVKGKLLWWNMMVLIFTLAVFAIIGYFSLRKYLYLKVDDILTTECQEISAQLLIKEEKIHIVFEKEWEESEHVGFGENAIYIQIRSTNGKVIKQSQNVANLDLSFPPARIYIKVPYIENIRLKQVLFRKIDFPIHGEEEIIGFITAAYPMEGTENYLFHTRTAFFVMTPICLLLSLLGMWVVSKNALNPISRIIDTAQCIIRSGDLQHRISSKNTDRELEELIDTLNHLFKELESSFEQIKNFSANASHELRTPLTVIRGNIEVALSKKRATAEYQQTLENLLEEVLKMTNITNNLLLLARIESDKIDMDMTIIRLDKLLLNNLQLLNPLFNSQKIQVRSEVEEHIEIVGNSSRLNELISNLIENAIKYNRERGQVLVRLFKNDKNAVLEIEDTGIGIPENEQEKIFERFYRVDKTRSREFGGSGLGLSIVKWIVAEHKGNIFVKSKLGLGTCFKIELPLLEYGFNPLCLMI